MHHDDPQNLPMPGLHLSASLHMPPQLQDVQTACTHGFEVLQMAHQVAGLCEEAAQPELLGCQALLHPYYSLGILQELECFVSNLLHLPFLLV